MKRFTTLLMVVALTACCAPMVPATAQTVSHTSVKPKSGQAHKVSLRHEQLTLYPHGKPAKRQSAYGSAYSRFNHPSPIHNTFMGVQRW
jgi:hypothetical protein